MAPDAVRRSFVTAQHTVAFTLLTVAVLMALVFQNARPTEFLWPSSIALLPALGLLLVGKRIRVIPWSLSYLVVGGMGVYLYALSLLSPAIPVHNSDGFTFLVVKAALMMVGGITLGTWPGIAWAMAGYVTSELAVGLAQINVGMPLNFDLASFMTLAATVTVIPLVSISNRHHMRVLPRLQRAAHDEHLAVLRDRIEVKAAALMHDTVLNHLAALADSESDRLDPELGELMRRDMEVLTGEGWLAETATSSDRKTRADWQHSGLFTAIQEGRLLGLDVTTTGDLAAVGRLEREPSIALGLAVKQCLVNVLKHSGTRQAEVAVYHTEEAVSVMVVDSGCGFIEAATGTDRLGLRSSVRKRIELVGGLVNVWSTPGRGTSIMIRVPTSQRSASISPGNETAVT